MHQCSSGGARKAPKMYLPLPQLEMENGPSPWMVLKNYQIDCNMKNNLILY